MLIKLLLKNGACTKRRTTDLINLGEIFKTFRSRGYTLEHSIAELADNSITHNAKNIWTYMYWSDDAGKNSFIMVIDDGDGMNENELLNKALKHCSLLLFS